MTTSEEVWQEYHSKLRAFIRRRISDDTATDDILQEVFVKMHSGLASLKDATKLPSWLYQIARNAIADHYRLQRPTVEIPEWLTNPVPDAKEKMTQELSDCLLPMIERLPETYREAVTLSEIKGVRQKDVAEMQGTSLSGAKSRVQRGRALLKEMLADCCLLEFDHQGRLCCYQRKIKADNSC